MSDRDCEVLHRVELMERYLKTHQKGNLYTPDSREEFVQPKSEVYRILYGSQALGYLNLYAATGKQLYLREATGRLEALMALGDVMWSNSAWDGDLGFTFLRAYEYTGKQSFLDAGIATSIRLAQVCRPGAYIGECELNWGLSAAMCLAHAYRIKEESYLLDAARSALARTQRFQHEDGSLPHQPDYQARNLAYSSWVAFQLMEYSAVDSNVRSASQTTPAASGSSPTLDFNLMLTGLVSFLNRQVTDDGRIFYSGDRRLSAIDSTLCPYCSSSFYLRCKEYCGQICGSSYDVFPCNCIHEPPVDCPKMAGTNEPDPLCIYCTNPMYANCLGFCRNICEKDSIAFPCHCVTDPETQCPGDSMWIETFYYDDRDVFYDTRGWTSELASTAFVLAKAGEDSTKERVLNFLFSLQNKDGSFPDKWGYKSTEQAGASLWLGPASQHSVMRTSIIFRVLSSLLVPSADPVIAALPVSQRAMNLGPSVRRADGLTANLATVHPNPSSGGVTLRFILPSGSGSVELVIVDIAGRNIKNLGQLPRDSEASEVIWNGKDESGERVAPGVYFAQMIGEGWHSAKKLVILNKSR